MVEAIDILAGEIFNGKDIGENIKLYSIISTWTI